MISIHRINMVTDFALCKFLQNLFPNSISKCKNFLKRGAGGNSLLRNLSTFNNSSSSSSWVSAISYTLAWGRTGHHTEPYCKHPSKSLTCRSFNFWSVQIRLPQPAHWRQLQEDTALLGSNRNSYCLHSQNIS